MQQTPQPSVDIGAAIGAGWRRLWPNVVPMAVFALIVVAINAVMPVFQADAGPVAGFLLAIISFVVSQLISIGWIKVALDITDGRRVSGEAIVDRFRLIGPYLIAALLYSLMVFVGLVLLVVPGIIVGIVFAFYGFWIVDTAERDPIGALRRSAELTRGHRGQLFLLFLVLFLLNILGVLLLLVGVLFTAAISLLAVADVYRQLSPARPAPPDPAA